MREGGRFELGIHGPLVRQWYHPLADDLDELAFVRSFPGRCYEGWEYILRPLLWSATRLWPDSAQTELGLADPPSVSGALEAVYAHYESEPAARAALADVIRDPSANVLDRCWILHRLRAARAHADEVVPMLLDVLARPRSRTSRPLTTLDALPPGEAPADPVREAEVFLRRNALWTLQHLEPAPAALAPRLRAIWADPQVAEDTGYTLEQLLAELGSG